MKNKKQFLPKKIDEKIADAFDNSHLMLSRPATDWDFESMNVESNIIEINFINGCHLNISRTKKAAELFKYNVLISDFQYSKNVEEKWNIYIKESKEEVELQKSKILDSFNGLN